MRDLNDYELSLYRNGYRLDEHTGEWSKPPKADRVAPDAQQESNSINDTVAEDEAKDDHPGFRFVRLTSYRTHLLDERNLWDAYFTDSLVKAGLLRDDSPAWAKIEVEQKQVSDWHDQRTEIELFEL